VAFVQGGVGNPDSSPMLTSLASLYFEPLWVFHRSEMRLARLTDLRGKRIAVGPEQSGTRAIALQLLADNALDDREASLLSVGAKRPWNFFGRGRWTLRSLWRPPVPAWFMGCWSEPMFP